MTLHKARGAGDGAPEHLCISTFLSVKWVLQDRKNACFSNCNNDTHSSFCFALNSFMKQLGKGLWAGSLGAHAAGLGSEAVMLGTSARAGQTVGWLECPRSL